MSRYSDLSLKAHSQSVRPKKAAEEQGEGKKKAKAKKKADAEKLGWGIGFKELIARAGIDVNDAQQMDSAELQL